MARTPASRIQRVQPPATLAAGEKARQLARQGHDVIDLGQSSPHHVTPPHIVEAGINALNQGLTNISSSRGLPELRQAMAVKLVARNGRSIDPDGDILVTPGSKMGLYEAINAYIERGDEALVLEPTWVSFSQQVEMAEGIPVAVPLSEEEEYYITYERLKEYVTPQSKMLIINNPNNPTGRVYTLEELEAVARVVIEHDLLVVCDETYEYFTYDGNSHLTIATLEGMAERTLTSYTFTKAYSMAGWRLGCIVAQAESAGTLAQDSGADGQFRFPLRADGRRGRPGGPPGPPDPVAGGLQRAAHPLCRPPVPGAGHSLSPARRRDLPVPPLFCGHDLGGTGRVAGGTGGRGGNPRRRFRRKRRGPLPHRPHALPRRPRAGRRRTHSPPPRIPLSQLIHE